MAMLDSNDAIPERPAQTGNKSGGGGPLANIVGPFTKAGGYYARSWGAYLDGDRGELPVARPTLSLATHALRDEIVLVGLRLRRPLSDAAVYERINAEVVKAIDFYGKRGWLARPEGFFAAPPAPTDVSIKTFKSRGRAHERMSFESGYQPYRGEPGRDRWLSYTGNHREYALMLRHEEPRPWLVCVHGTEMGRANLDLTLFRAWHLHEDFGLNVVLPVLPMHGPRAKGLPKGAVFPGEDVMDDVHATAQAVWDIRRVLAWIRSQQPGARIGLNSISLGGYIAALVASLDDELTCAILGVPPANLVSILGRHAGLGADDPRHRTLELAEPIGDMISPLSLQPKVAPEGRFIYAGVADRIVHPREQVLGLWEHWGRPNIGWYRGGHTGFFQARPVQQFVDAALVQSGLVDSGT
ncbi:alpha/beta hydrolase family protein [Mycobacterium pinniadriaticum]